MSPAPSEPVPISAEQWLGRDCTAIDAESLERAVHVEVVEPLRELRAAAARAGFDLALASGHRDFQRQRQIWNDKAEGRRPVLDDRGAEVALHALPAPERVCAIWRFSALPGTSRHHWGSDVDVYDRAALASPRLLPEEYAPGGPCHDFSRWLGERMRHGRALDFFRPYARDRGGIAVEPWHLSYAPLAARFERSLCPRTLARHLETADVALAATVLERLDDYWQRYVRVDPADYPQAWRP